MPTYQPHPDALFTLLHEGTSEVLHLQLKAQFRLNETGTRIWRLLGDDLEQNEVAKALDADFEVNLEQAKRSVAKLVASPLEHELILRI